MKIDCGGEINGKKENNEESYIFVFLPFMFKLIIKYYTSSHWVHDGPYGARLLGYHSIGQGGVLSVQTVQHLYNK